jgi:hypothetical protein
VVEENPISHLTSEDIVSDARLPRNRLGRGDGGRVRRLLDPTSELGHPGVVGAHCESEHGEWQRCGAGNRAGPFEMEAAEHPRKPAGGDPSKHHNLLKQTMRSWRQSTWSGAELFRFQCKPGDYPID